MIIDQLMTRDVLTVDPAAGFKDMVRLLETHHVSALPVIDPERRVIGVVSEADLMLKEERDSISPRRLPFERKTRRVERAKAAGRTAYDLMTSPAITVRPEAPVQQAARLMHKNAVKRLPVVDASGRLVGIISRADVLRVFLREDDDIRREIVEEVIKILMIDPASIRVSVRDGIVDLSGRAERKSDVGLIAGLAAASVCGSRA